jgi:hypothetical protein
MKWRKHDSTQPAHDRYDAGWHRRRSNFSRRHDLRPLDPSHRFEEYEAIVNRSAQVKQVYQWPNIANAIVFPNIRMALTAFSFNTTFRQTRFRWWCRPTRQRMLRPTTTLFGRSTAGVKRSRFVTLNKPASHAHYMVRYIGRTYHLYSGAATGGTESPVLR